MTDSINTVVTEPDNNIDISISQLNCGHTWLLKELEVTKSLMDKVQKELIVVKTESHKRKHIIAAQQKIMQTNKDDFHKVNPTLYNSTFISYYYINHLD